MTGLSQAEPQVSALTAVSANGLPGDLAQLALQQAHFAVFLLDPNGRLVYANPYFCRLLGRSESELHQQRVLDLTHPDDRVGGRERMDRLLSGQLPRMRVDKRYLRPDGSVVWARLTIQRVEVAGLVHLLVVAHEVGEDGATREALRRSEASLRLALAGGGAGLWDWNLHTDIVEYSDAFARLLQYRGDDFHRDFLFRDRLHPDDREAALAAVANAIDHGAPFDCHYRLLCFDGRYRWFQGRGMSHVGDDGQRERFSGILIDLDERLQTEAKLRSSEAELAFLAHHDTLTHLPNRLLWVQRLEQALHEAQRDNTRLAVLLLDLDHFKDVNDSYGHAVGDELLCHMAQRLENRLRQGDTLARLGGDEFVLLMRSLQHPEDAARLAQNLIETLAEPWRSEHGFEMTLGVSVGIALYPEHGQDANVLLQGADAALYRAKGDGRGVFRYFADDMTRAARERLQLESSLRRALACQHFELHYQPQVDLASGRVVGAEALLRWNDPVLGGVTPDRFIPVAEACGLMVELGAWVLGQACAAWARWQAAGWGHLQVAVNVSPRQFQQGDLVACVTDCLLRHGMPAHALELEITEGVLMERGDEALRILHRLHDLGVSVAVDDFGTGYSSLAYLKRFPVDVLKIDRGFIMDIPGDKDDVEITAAIIAMGQSLGLQLVAEGVEDELQWAFLREHGCHRFQGYYRSKPLPEVQFMAFLRQA
jgi:diguanylate cyclase (GGDEF)-like protein/PAS domain S-box-containing protein